MRYILTLLFLLIYLFSFSQNEIKEDTLIENDKIIGYGKTQNGERIGTWYFPDLYSKKDYDLWTYVGDSTIMRQHFYDSTLLRLSYIKTDRKEGEYIIFKKDENSENKYIYNIFYFKNGKLNGYWYTFYPSQSIAQQEYYVNDTLQGKYYIYYENGMLKEQGEFKSGTYNNERKSYYPSGKLESIAFLKSVVEANYFHLVYYSDTNKGYYYSDIDPNAISIKVNDWKFYNEKGILIKEEFYDEGQLLKIVQYDDNGNLLKAEDFLHNWKPSINTHFIGGINEFNKVFRNKIKCPQNSKSNKTDINSIQFKIDIDEEGKIIDFNILTVIGLAKKMVEDVKEKIYLTSGKWRTFIKDDQKIRYEIHYNMKFDCN